MKILSFLTISAVSFVVLFDACTVQDHQPRPDPGCQVLTFTAIEKSSRSEIPYWQPLDETAQLDGKPVQIGTKYTEKYTFDEQNRLSRYYAEPNGNFSTTTLNYSYEPGLMKGGYSDIALNEQGLLADISTNTQVPTYYKYNADGYLIRKETPGLVHTYTIVDGNLINEEVVTVPTQSKMLYEYEYDLTRPNLPNIAPQEGKTSKNLPTKLTTKNYVQTNEDPYVNVFEYKYEYDENGRVKRLYFLDTSASVPYYRIKDFSYTCR
jgi:YD repeat-containing protein